MTENVNWFPKHMKGSEDLLKKNLKAVNIVFEVLDARAPLSSKDMNIDRIIGQKAKIIILNKCDLSSDEGNKKWVSFFNKGDTEAALVSAVKGDGLKNIANLARKVITKAGIKHKSIRAMVVGIPNVGKSTLINCIAGKKKAKASNKPGVTRFKQWIETKSQLELLDTPGILRPREDKETFLHLAFIGTINDDVLDVRTLASDLIEKLVEIVPEELCARFKIDIKDKTPLEIMENIAAKRGCLLKAGIIDYMRVSGIVLSEFRKGKLGKITLEYPDC
ncbi:MAG: ribosome biogenesis GTPase YlqF [Deltaproteobacteria bacterium]|nr:ribosome biogenesis GTPase YlqF [Deltaproteobacteria bacterium]